MFAIILIALGVLIVLAGVIVALQPSTFRVTRSALIAAPPAAAFEQVVDFQKWLEWSPWEKLDPAMKRSLSSPSSGPGATYTWVGNKNVGEGSMTLIESRPPEYIRIQLDFLKPFKCTNNVEFTFQSEGEQTRVTWTMSGANNFMSKAIGLVMSMDKMVGGNFEEGLRKMKEVAEAMPASS